MPPSTLLPPVPANTVRAAEAAFGKGNLYLTIGDQAGHLFAGANLAGLDGSGEKSGEKRVAWFARLALTTIFQSLERLPDRQASEAVRLRTDWKYALHLPLDSPGFSPEVLCDFRQQLLADAAGQQVFQQILDRLGDIGRPAGQDTRRMDAGCVLIAVCTLSRLDVLARAMRLALESIASNCPEWLRANALPHWYERYAQTPTMLRQPHTREDWDEMTCAIGSDARYLLETISHESVLGQLPEVQALRREWYRQYEPCSGAFQWRSPRCAHCQEDRTMRA